MSFAAIGVCVDGDQQFRIRVKLKPQGAWQDWEGGRLYDRAEALTTLVGLGLAPARAQEMIAFAVARGTPAPEVRRPVKAAPIPPTLFPDIKGRRGRCPTCDVPALANAPDGIGYFCLACGYAAESA